MAELLPFGATEFKEGLFEELDIEAGVFNACRCFDVNWSDRFQFVGLFLPLFTSHENLVQLPRSYPDFQAAVAYRYELVKPLLKADQFGNLETFVDAGEDGDISVRQISYDKARVKIHYKADGQFLSAGQNEQGEAGTKPRIEINIDSEIEVIELNGAQVKNRDGRRKADQKFNLINPLYNIKIHYPELNNPGFSSILSNPGRINESVLGLYRNNGELVMEFPANTLRYDGPSAVTRISYDGEARFRPSWDITHSFVYNERRWDRIVTGVRWDDIDIQNANTIYDDVRLFPHSNDSFAFVPNFANLGP